MRVPLDSATSFNDTDGESLADVSAYQRLIGKLMYLTISRPGIAYAVNRLSQFMQKSRTSHLAGVHHVLQYLKGTPDKGLFFPSKSSYRITAFADADWGSCKVTRKSTIGFCVFFGDALISWKSKKQPTVARSSAEAEYRALASLTSELLWIRQLLRTFEVNVQFVMNVQNQFLKLIHVKSTQQLADPLTKVLPWALYDSLTSKWGMVDIYLPT
ncbi:uncharacterized mitochondrial protein AtMg00810-like [Vicia villosa]|uniref:uncharacterized mitochondrial protein AtMg00810-like n=1 Tax=Vicia villosa TaxID=3911 RepID=UPI00273AB090|nr:uncharacterized mitochondrial protein AtMg00810-like [Vicia villosa]